MAKFKIEIATDNAAFGDEPGHELSLLLREIANHCANNLQVGRYYTAPIRDTNGNTVGKCTYTK